jgi:hypothetical protein
VALMTVDTVGTNSARLCMPVKVLQPVKTKLVSSPAVFRDANNPVLGQGIVLVPVGQVLAGFEDDVGRNSPSCGIDALDDCYPLPIARLDLLCSSWLPCICNNYSRAYLAHHEACLVEVVRVVVQDAILGFDVRYKGKPALYNLRVLAEGSLIVVLAIKDCFKLLLTRNERAGLP